MRAIRTPLALIASSDTVSSIGGDRIVKPASACSGVVVVRGVSIDVAVVVVCGVSMAVALLWCVACQ
jgi:hypothetical protein